MKFPLQRQFAALTLTAFFVSQFYGQTPSAWAQPEVPALPSFSLDLPAELGSVEALHAGRGPVVFHIQEAHGNIEGQKNIQKILKHLNSRYGVNTVLLEGDAFPLKPELLRFFPEDMPRTMKVLDQLAEKGVITGPELFLAETKGAQALGIEDLKPYVQNGQAFYDVLKSKDVSEKLLNNLKLQIDRRLSRSKNAALRDFLKEQEKFESQIRSASEQWVFLKQKAAEYLNLHLEQAREQIDWPMLVRVNVLTEMEKKFNQGEFEKQREQFLYRVQSPEYSVKKETQYAVRGALYESFASAGSQNLETQIENLVASLPRDFDFKAYPQVNRFIGHKLLAQELKASQLMKEIETLTEKITDKLAKTKEEKEIVEQIKDYKLLKKLLNLELTSEEYEQIKKLEDGGKKLETAWKSFFPTSNFQLLTSSLEFYRLAKERDGIMIRNIEKRVQGHKTQVTRHKQLPVTGDVVTGDSVVVVITGGFHSKPFETYFKDHGYNYALISPKMSSAEGNKEYVKSVLRDFVPSLSLSLRRSEATEAISVMPDFLPARPASSPELQRGKQAGIRHPDDGSRVVARDDKVSAYRSPDYSQGPAALKRLGFSSRLFEASIREALRFELRGQKFKPTFRFRLKTQVRIKSSATGQTPKTVWSFRDGKGAKKKSTPLTTGFGDYVGMPDQGTDEARSELRLDTKLPSTRSLFRQSEGGHIDILVMAALATIFLWTFIGFPLLAHSPTIKAWIKEHFVISTLLFFVSIPISLIGVWIATVFVTSFMSRLKNKATDSRGDSSKRPTTNGESPRQKRSEMRNEEEMQSIQEKTETVLQQIPPLLVSLNEKSTEELIKLRSRIEALRASIKTSAKNQYRLTEFRKNIQETLNQIQGALNLKVDEVVADIGRWSQSITLDNVATWQDSWNRNIAPKIKAMGKLTWPQFNRLLAAQMQFKDTMAEKIGLKMIAIAEGVSDVKDVPQAKAQIDGWYGIPDFSLRLKAKRGEAFRVIQSLIEKDQTQQEEKKEQDAQVEIKALAKTELRNAQLGQLVNQVRAVRDSFPSPRPDSIDKVYFKFINKINNELRRRTKILMDEIKVLKSSLDSDSESTASIKNRLNEVLTKLKPQGIDLRDRTLYGGAKRIRAKIKKLRKKIQKMERAAKQSRSEVRVESIDVDQKFTDAAWNDIKKVFFGADIFDSNRPQDNRLSAGVARVTSESMLTPHTHPYGELYYIWEGEALVTVGSKRVRLKAGDFMYVPANTVHTVKVEDGKSPVKILFIYKGTYNSPGATPEEQAQIESATSVETSKLNVWHAESAKPDGFNPADVAVERREVSQAQETAGDANTPTMLVAYRAGNVLIDGESTPFTAGQAMMIPAGKRFEIKPNDTSTPLNFFTVRLNPSLGESPRFQRAEIRNTLPSHLELLNPAPKNMNIELAVLDWDGTISRIREGWEGIMAPYAAAIVAGKEITNDEWNEILQSVKDEEKADSETLMTSAMKKMVESGKISQEIMDWTINMIENSKGDPTPLQFKQAYDRAVELGNKDAADDFIRKLNGNLDDPKDALTKVYLDKLYEVRNFRLEQVSSGAKSSDHFLIPGGAEFIRELQARGAKVWVITGSEQQSVQNEVDILQLHDVQVRGYEIGKPVVTKKVMMEKLQNESGITKGSKILAVGDGKREIEFGVALGWVTIAVPSHDNARHFDKILALNPNFKLSKPNYNPASELAAYLIPHPRTDAQNIDGDAATHNLEPVLLSWLAWSPVLLLISAAGLWAAVKTVKMFLDSENIHSGVKVAAILAFSTAAAASLKWIWPEDENETSQNSATPQPSDSSNRSEVREDSSRVSARLPDFRRINRLARPWRARQVFAGSPVTGLLAHSQTSTSNARSTASRESPRLQRSEVRKLEQSQKFPRPYNLYPSEGVQSQQVIVSGNNPMGLSGNGTLQNHVVFGVTAGGNFGLGMHQDPVPLNRVQENGNISFGNQNPHRGSLKDVKAFRDQVRGDNQNNLAGKKRVINTPGGVSEEKSRNKNIGVNDHSHDQIAPGEPFHKAGESGVQSEGFWKTDLSSFEPKAATDLNVSGAVVSEQGEALLLGRAALRADPPVLQPASASIQRSLFPLESPAQSIKRSTPPVNRSEVRGNSLRVSRLASEPVLTRSPAHPHTRTPDTRSEMRQTLGDELLDLNNSTNLRNVVRVYKVNKKAGSKTLIDLGNPDWRHTTLKENEKFEFDQGKTDGYPVDNLSHNIESLLNEATDDNASQAGKEIAMKSAIRLFSLNYETLAAHKGQVHGREAELSLKVQELPQKIQQTFVKVFGTQEKLLLVGKMGGTTIGWNLSSRWGILDWRHEEPTHVDETGEKISGKSRREVEALSAKNKLPDIMERLTKQMAEYWNAAIEVDGKKYLLKTLIAGYVLSAPGWFDENGALIANQENISNMNTGYYFDHPNWEHSIPHTLLNQRGIRLLGRTVHDGTAHAMGEMNPYYGTGVTTLVYFGPGSGIAHRVIINGKAFTGGEAISFSQNELPNYLMLQERREDGTTVWKADWDLGNQIAKGNRPGPEVAINSFENQTAGVAKERRIKAELDRKNITVPEGETAIGFAIKNHRAIYDEINNQIARELGAGFMTIVGASKEKFSDEYPDIKDPNFHVVIGGKITTLEDLENVKRGAKEAAAANPQWNLTDEDIDRMFVLSSINDDVREFLAPSSISDEITKLNQTDQAKQVEWNALSKTLQIAGGAREVLTSFQITEENAQTDFNHAFRYGGPVQQLIEQLHSKHKYPLLPINVRIANGLEAKKYTLFWPANTNPQSIVFQVSPQQWKQRGAEGILVAFLAHELTLKNLDPGVRQIAEAENGHAAKLPSASDENLSVTLVDLSSVTGAFVNAQEFRDLIRAGAPQNAYDTLQSLKLKERAGWPVRHLQARKMDKAKVLFNNRFHEYLEILNHLILAGPFRHTPHFEVLVNEIKSIYSPEKVDQALEYIDSSEALRSVVYSDKPVTLHQVIHDFLKPAHLLIGREILRQKIKKALGDKLPNGIRIHLDGLSNQFEFVLKEVIEGRDPRITLTPKTTITLSSVAGTARTLNGEEAWSQATPETFQGYDALTIQDPALEFAEARSEVRDNGLRPPARLPSDKPARSPVASEAGVGGFARNRLTRSLTHSHTGTPNPRSELRSEPEWIAKLQNPKIQELARTLTNPDVGGVTHRQSGPIESFDVQVGTTPQEFETARRELLRLATQAFDQEAFEVLEKSAQLSDLPKDRRVDILRALVEIFSLKGISQTKIEEIETHTWLLTGAWNGFMTGLADPSLDVSTDIQPLFAQLVMQAPEARLIEHLEILMNTFGKSKDVDAALFARNNIALSKVLLDYQRDLSTKPYAVLGWKLLLLMAKRSIDQKRLHPLQPGVLEAIFSRTIGEFWIVAKNLNNLTQNIRLIWQLAASARTLETKSQSSSPRSEVRFNHPTLTSDQKEKLRNLMADVEEIYKAVQQAYFFEKQVQKQDKANATPATLADYLAQMKIMLTLRDMDFFKTDVFLGEEAFQVPNEIQSMFRKNQSLTKSYQPMWDQYEKWLKEKSFPKLSDVIHGKRKPNLWIVDPLDSTRSFIAKKPGYACSVARAVWNSARRRYEVVYGMIYAPGHGSKDQNKDIHSPLIEAEKGKEVNLFSRAVGDAAKDTKFVLVRNLKDNPVKPSRNAKMVLRHSISSGKNPFEDRWRKESFEHPLDTEWSGTAVGLLELALGNIVGYHSNMSLWDHAAGDLMNSMLGRKIYRVDSGKSLARTWFSLNDIQSTINGVPFPVMAVATSSPAERFARKHLRVKRSSAESRSELRQNISEKLRGESEKTATDTTVHSSLFTLHSPTPSIRSELRQQSVITVSREIRERLVPESIRKEFGGNLFEAIVHLVTQNSEEPVFALDNKTREFLEHATPHLKQVLDQVISQQGALEIKADLNSQHFDSAAWAFILLALNSNANFKYAHYLKSGVDQEAYLNKVHQLGKQLGVNVNALKNLSIQMDPARVWAMTRAKNPTAILASNRDRLENLGVQSKVARVAVSDVHESGLLLLSTVQLLQGVIDQLRIYEQSQLTRNLATDALRAELAALRTFLSAA